MPAKVVKVIVTTTRFGKGTDNDPVRLIPELYTLDGHLICWYDEHINPDTNRKHVDTDQLWRLLNDNTEVF